jgi:hypothetical protein
VPRWFRAVLALAGEISWFCAPPRPVPGLTHIGRPGKVYSTGHSLGDRHWSLADAGKGPCPASKVPGMAWEENHDVKAVNHCQCRAGFVSGVELSKVEALERNAMQCDAGTKPRGSRIPTISTLPSDKLTGNRACESLSCSKKPRRSAQPICQESLVPSRIWSDCSD